MTQISPLKTDLKGGSQEVMSQMFNVGFRPCMVENCPLLVDVRVCFLCDHPEFNMATKGDI